MVGSTKQQFHEDELMLELAEVGKIQIDLLLLQP